jgi:hypothetical protein
VVEGALAKESPYENAGAPEKIEQITPTPSKQASMGQYYYAIILNAEGEIIAWMNANAYGEGVKLMEHSYLDSDFVNTVEFLLSPEGPYY